MKISNLKLDFKECTLQKLEKTFGLKQIKQMPALTAWLEGQADISDYEHQMLEHLQEKLSNHAHDWNEDELTFGFIAPHNALCRLFR